MTEQELIQLRHKLSDEYKKAVLLETSAYMAQSSAYNIGYRVGIEFALQCLGYTNTMLEVLAQSTLSK